jgi:hypothetical protein
MSFYMTYLARWPDYFHAAVNPAGRVMGYSMSLVLVLDDPGVWLVHPASQIAFSCLFPVSASLLVGLPEYVWSKPLMLV